MKLKFLNTEFSVSFPAVAFLCLAIICDKEGNMLICLTSAVLHELGHVLAMKIKGVSVKSVAFNIGEVAIKADSSSLSYIDELFVSAGGVVVNFLLSAIFCFVYKLSGISFCYTAFVSNLAVGVFNMLPVRFLDGGDILILILQRLVTRRTADIILTVFTVVFIIPVFISGLIFIFNSSYNYSLFFAAVYLICTLVSKEFRNVS